MGWREDTASVAISGELDFCTAAALARMLGAVLAQRPERLALDLAGVTFMDCAAARVLAAASRDLPGTGRAVIGRISRPARRTLHLAGLSSCFEIADGSPGYRSPPPRCDVGGRVAVLTRHRPLT
jgi:anti-anti-sigma factor